jgi:anti-sigma regulatory factor (Ser/Thr protein kinase)
VLRPGDALFVCTDGVIEAVNANGELYGNDRLKANLITGRGDTPEDIVRLVKERVDAFAGRTPMADDLTMVALRWDPTKPRMTTELVIASDLAQLAVLTETMERVGGAQGVPGKALVHIQVALDEIVTNIIKYAWTDGGSHEIHIRIEALADGVRLEIIDDGVAFNPLLAPPPAKPSSGTRRPGGVGLHMVRQLVDALEYARIDGCNHVTLIKKCVVGATNP